MQHVIAYVAAMAVFFAVDFAWLTLIARGFYRDRLGPLLLENFNLPVAAGFYLIYIVGIVVFAIAPALRTESWPTATLLGGLLGLVAYGTYDMTNLATLRGWSPSVAVVDMVWGVALTALAATLGYLVARQFG